MKSIIPREAKKVNTSPNEMSPRIIIRFIFLGGYLIAARKRSNQSFGRGMNPKYI